MDLELPFFEQSHRQFATELGTWCKASLPSHDESDDVDGVCRELVMALGKAGWLRHCVPAPYGAPTELDVRTLCIARQTLAYHAGLADFAFAMQGLGSGAISLFGSDELKGKYLPE